MTTRRTALEHPAMRSSCHAIAWVLISGLAWSCMGGGLCAAQSADAMDWRRPWRAPQSARLAARHSDEYAWRLFVAINWPADVSKRAADHRAVLGAAGPVVWETWQNTADVFLDNGLDPGPWVAGGPALTADSAQAMVNETRFETLSPRDLEHTRRIVAGAMVPLVDPLAEAQRLIEVRMNRVSFDYIRSLGLYNVEGQLHAVAQGRSVKFPLGAVQVKASWRPIAASQKSRYHTITVRFADGATRLYGLTALNIAAKELPHWFWASFEHVDNATRDSAGWELASRDSFACRGALDCNRAPSGVGLEGTVWENYRLRGTLTSFVDAEMRPRLLGNSELEAGFQRSASCITCHSRASIGVVGRPLRLPVFDTSTGAGDSVRRGYVGLPRPEWFSNTGFEPLDFVWSLSQARSRVPDSNNEGDSP